MGGYRKVTIVQLCGLHAIEINLKKPKIFLIVALTVENSVWYNRNVSINRILFDNRAEKKVVMSKSTVIKELPACPVETTLTLIGDKWKVLILRDLLTGTKRFGELKKSLGNVPQKVLTAQLRDMEESGLVNRKVYAEVPPRVEYSLTVLGESLNPILDAMKCWGESYKNLVKE